jgi:hypothetical protein
MRAPGAVCFQAKLIPQFLRKGSILFVDGKGALQNARGRICARGHAGAHSGFAGF